MGCYIGSSEGASSREDAAGGGGRRREARDGHHALQAVKVLDLGFIGMICVMRMPAGARAARQTPFAEQVRGQRQRGSEQQDESKRQQDP
jgi:hypothetical protein